MPGRATKNSHEMDTMAMPNNSATHGDISTAVPRTKSALCPSARRSGGGSSPSGQALRTMYAVNTVRKATKASASSASPTHDR